MSEGSIDDTPAVDLKQLRAYAESPLWTEERSSLTYSYPLPTDEETSQKSARLAEGVAGNMMVKNGPFSTALSPDSHLGPYKSAIDFLVDDDTPVLAAQDGEVFAVVDGNERWGPSPEFANALNYITLRHSDGEFSEYAHLAQGSVVQLGLHQGVAVKQGQQIGIVGKSGWTDRDHLHFIVYRLDNGTVETPNPFKFKSLIPVFSQTY